MTNAALIRKYDLQERIPIQCDHDYSDLPNVASISEYKEAAISYIGGFVGKTVAKKLSCHECRNVLGSRNSVPSSQFLQLKDRGNLYKPSQSVITVCKETEKCFQRMLAATAGKLPHSNGIVGAIATSVLGSINASSLFTEIDDHMYDSTVDDNHVYRLIKEIVNCYCKVRLYHLGKETTAKLSDKNIQI